MTTETQILTDEQIAQVLNDAGVTEYADVPLRYDLEVARAIEQAVLQSPEVQALRDAAVLSTIKRAEYFGKGHSAGWKSALEAAIDKVAIHGGSVEIEAAIRTLLPSTPA